MIKDCIKNNLFIEAIELIDSKILLKIKWNPITYD
jgi:hypothetical protein